MNTTTWLSYQNATSNHRHDQADEEELMILVGNYGSVLHPEEEIGSGTGIPLGAVTSDFTASGRKRWILISAASLLYVAVAAAWAWNRSTMVLSSSTASSIELLGKSKVEKETKKAKKIKVKEAKKNEKEAEKEKKKEEKEKMKEEEEKKKEEEKYEKEKKKEAEKNEKEAEKKKKEEEKETIKAEKEKLKEEEKSKKLVFEPTPYPGCETVNITYVKTPLPFWDHEFAANASGCHLASIHSFEENTKLSKDGLFQMSLGPEIAMSFMSGKPLSKVFWIGGYHFESDIDESEWTDDSVYDFGPYLVNATEGCISSTFNFTEIAIKNLTFEDHWSISDCETPLPAIYKCCTKPLAEATQIYN